MSFFIISKDGISFPQKYDLIFKMENKRWSFSKKKKKIHGNILYSSNVLKKRSLQKQRTGIWSFFYHQERWDFFLPEICNFFYGRKIKDDLPQKIYGNMMFSVCSVKLVFLFPTNMKWPFCQKRKDDLFPKNTPKIDISSITEKDVFVLEKRMLSV